MTLVLAKTAGRQTVALKGNCSYFCCLYETAHSATANSYICTTYHAVDSPESTVMTSCVLCSCRWAAAHGHLCNDPAALLGLHQPLPRKGLSAALCWDGSWFRSQQCPGPDQGCPAAASGHPLPVCPEPWGPAGVWPGGWHGPGGGPHPQQPVPWAQQLDWTHGWGGSKILGRPWHEPGTCPFSVPCRRCKALSMLRWRCTSQHRTFPMHFLHFIPGPAKLLALHVPASITSGRGL